MKKLLPLLLCYVLMTAQSFALSGGPVFGGSTQSYIGSYAGALQGLEVTNNTFATSANGNTVSTGSTTTPSNAIGLFTLGVPQTDEATGSFTLFSSGVFFNGTVTGIVDPNKGKLFAVVQGSFSFTVTSSTGTTTTTSSALTATAAGSINASIGSSGNSSSHSGRISGGADVQINFGEARQGFVPIVNQDIQFKVTGFRQSTTATTSATTGTSTGTTGGGSTS